MAEPDRFVFGTQYYRAPNPPRSDWARDLRLIREHGMTTVKLWASWGWMHRGPGSVDFDELDELLNLARANELDVVVNTILENAPYWLGRELPDARYVGDDGRPVQLTAAINTPTGGWPGLCFDNEPARAAAEEFLEAVVGRYREHPALSVWDVWNEPHLEPTWYYPERQFCYCDASQRAFRTWLQGRYDDLGSLNRVWARRYSAWDEVEPPRVFETYPDLIDWREFWLENLRTWLEWKVALVRRLDQSHPVMTHVASSAYLGTLTQNVWDEWLLSDPVDIFGTSSFPRWLMDDDPVVHLFHLEATRAAARGKPFWQAELQGGRGRREGLASTPHQDARRTTMWIWTALAAGAKGVLFWQWRPELLGPESPGYGLCTPAGEPTERTAAAAEMARLIANFPELAASQPVPASVGIIVSRKTALLALAADRSMDVYARALLGTFRAFVDFDVPVRLLHEDEIAEAGVPAELEALYWPMPLFAERALADGLRAFVERGGVLVAEAAPGHHVEGGWCSPVIPSQGLDELFGAQEVESDVVAEVTIECGDRVLVGHMLRERLRTTTAEVAAQFDDGSPAVTRNRVGRGVAVLAGTVLSLAYEERRDAATGGWIAGLRDVEGRPPGVVTRLHDAGDAVLLFALNWSERPEQLALQRPPGAAEPLRATADVDVTGGRLALDVDPLDAVLVAFRKEKVTP